MQAEIVTMRTDMAIPHPTPATPAPPRQPAAATPAGGLAENPLQRLLGYQMAQATIVTQAVFERGVGGPLGLRPVEYTVLVLVTENPGVSPAQLSRALVVTRPNMTLWIDKLEARGLVKREKNAVDRRGQHLHATRQGAALAVKATQTLLDAERSACAALSDGERLMLAELLHKLACARGAPPAPAVSSRPAARPRAARGSTS